MVRIRAYRLTMTAPGAVALAGFALAFLGDGRASDVGSAAFIIGVVMSFLVRVAIVCPSCGKSPMSSDGVWPLTVRRLTPESVCSKCGYELEESTLAPAEEF